MSQITESKLEAPVLIIAGPTASGKSALALDVAMALQGEIINADSCQIYQGAPLLSACPTAEDKVCAPHHLYEIYPPQKNGNVVEWLDLAVAEIRSCRQRGRLPIVTGGTGLYINNLVYGTTPIPAVSEKIREEVAKRLADDGVLVLYEELKTFDNETALRLAPQDICRIRRAFEVYLETGKPLSRWHELPMEQRLENARFIVVKILPPKEALDTRCDKRFDKMMAQGALQEARYLTALDLDANSPVMQTIGIRELGAADKGELSLEEAVTAAKLRSRQYAKRQRTWFSRQLKADIDINCCYGGQKEILENVINYVKKAL